MMSPIYDNTLRADFPNLFAEEVGPPLAATDIWGVECGDGWYGLISSLCTIIQAHVDHTGITQPVLTQIKEKFGELRVYCKKSDAYIDGAICLAESMSSTLCEICGERAEIRNLNGWSKTLCQGHFEVHSSC